MQSADDAVQYLLLPAHVLEVSTEAVLVVDQLPDVAAVIGGVSLLVKIHVEVLTSVVFDVFHVPDAGRVVGAFSAPLLEV